MPVISAMQGDALGGGLVFGCYADIIVMGGRMSLYTQHPHKLGFLNPSFCLNQDSPDFRITRIKNQDQHQIRVI